VRNLSFLGVLLIAVSSCGFREHSAALSVVAEAAVQYPAEVSCLLSMQKVADPTGTSAEKLAHSCNDFAVSSDAEMRYVVGGCKLSHDFEGWAYKVNGSKCDRSSTYAICRVQDLKKPTDTIDTYYYLGTEPSSKPEVDKELVQASCKKMAGSLEVLAK